METFDRVQENDPNGCRSCLFIVGVIAALGVLFALALGALYIFAVTSGGDPFHARITAVSKRGACIVAVEATEWRRKRMCLDYSELFYSQHRLSLAVGDCVVVASHHPLLEIDRKVPRAECRPRRPTR